MNEHGTLTIGKVAKLANVNIQTLRYYERREILKPVARRESGYRLYDNEAARTVKFIKRAQNLGFSLEEIQDLLSMRPDRKSKCSEIRRRAVLTLQEVEKKLAKLQRMQRTLKRLIRDCGDRKVQAKCPVLASLEPEEVEA